jgi:hypothetical protein
VAQQGRDAAAEIEAAITMANDPAWELTSSYDASAILDLLESHARALSPDPAPIEPFLQAIATAR